MARKNDSILDILALLPWWVSVVLSCVVYVALKYIIPSIEIQPSGPTDFSYTFLKGIISSAPQFAPIIAIVLLVPAPISAINSRRKRKLLDKQDSINSIRKLSWNAFEELVGEAYRRQGYAVKENTTSGPDGGIDLVLKKDRELVIVQCKQWKSNKVGVKIVRELYGVQVSKKATKSILITSGYFTQEAKHFASGKPIDLVDGAELLVLIKGVQGKNSEPVTTSSSSSVECPKCGSEMIVRTTKKSSNAGQKFWGCSQFPKCRGTKVYENKSL